MGKIIKSNDLDINEIIVQTRAGSNISNAQSLFFSVWEKSQFPDIMKRYNNVKFRADISAIYNCHGLTFANRRTSIYYTEEIFKILLEDNYQEISACGTLPGDIIIYIAKNGDVEHSGLVISEPDQQLKIPLVLSKWGKYKEAIHYATNCPYDKTRIKYYRVIG